MPPQLFWQDGNGSCSQACLPGYCKIAYKSIAQLSKLLAARSALSVSSSIPTCTLLNAHLAVVLSFPEGQNYKHWSACSH